MSTQPTSPTDSERRPPAGALQAVRWFVGTLVVIATLTVFLFAFAVHTPYATASGTTTVVLPAPGLYAHTRVARVRGKKMLLVKSVTVTAIPRGVKATVVCSKRNRSLCARFAGPTHVSLKDHGRVADFTGVNWLLPHGSAIAVVVAKPKSTAVWRYATLVAAATDRRLVVGGAGCIDPATGKPEPCPAKVPTTGLTVPTSSMPTVTATQTVTSTQTSATTTATTATTTATTTASATVTSTTTATTTAPPPPPPPTYSETAGGVAHTWTDYADAGGTEGPSVGAGQTVQIACAITGFRVSDGNTWWYRIASSPWNSGYYVSADAFYNNGRTSGSLSGTPFVDPAVHGC